MTTLPPNYLRLSSKWLETNVAPEDVIFHYPYADLWAPSRYQGKLIPSYDRSQFTYATARTDLPKEAYLEESEPAPDLTQPGLPKAGLTQPEAASERAEVPVPCSTNSVWPMTDKVFIEYARWSLSRPNHGDAHELIDHALKRPKTMREHAMELESTIATLRAQLDAKEAECQQVREINKQSCADWADDDTEIKKLAAPFGIREDDTPGYFKTSVQIVEGLCAKFTEERDKLRAEVERLTKAAVPLCVGKPLIQILAKEGQWASGDGQGIVAADCLFQKDPYETITRLTAEVEHRAKQRDEFQNLFIEASDGFNRRGEQLARLTAELDAVRKENDWRKTTLKNREETLSKVSNDVVIARTERDASQARCGALERAAQDERRKDWIIYNCTISGGGNGFELRVFIPVDSECIRDAIDRIICADNADHERRPDSVSPIPVVKESSSATLTPSQQPDKETISNDSSSSTEGRAERVANRRGVTMPERGSSENQSSPAVTPSRPEPVKAGECPVCGAKEVEAYHPRTYYACGSSDYDQRPGTFLQSVRCAPPIAPEGKATEGEG